VGTIKIRMGAEAAAIPMLEEELQILEELPNLASSINTYGQLALAHLRLGKYDEALTYADRVIELAAKRSPTVYSVDIGFSAVADVYFHMWEKALQNPDQTSEADQYQSSVEKALQLLHGFRKVFPIGQAYAHYYQGWYEEQTGKPQKALSTWRKGLDAAQKFKLPYEEGLIRVRLGSSAREDLSTRTEHIQRAIEIFEKMGAVRELRFANWAWEALPSKNPTAG
jgi:tetratricopeptide (TPR) repeat protein